MRTFAQSESKDREPGPSAFGRVNRAESGAPHPVGLQRAMGATAQSGSIAMPANHLSRIPIYSPGGRYEHEADSVAEQVMRMPEPRLQRKCACGGACNGCRTEEADHQHLHMKRSGSRSFGRDFAPPIVHDALRSPGQPLDASTRAFMEPRFGHDFSRVRVHSDEPAAESASAIGASAYTVGEDIVFDRGQYSPGSTAGRSLLAHELTHVVQQTASHSGARSAAPGVQRQPHRRQAGPREATVNVHWADEPSDFFDRLLAALARSPGFRGIDPEYFNYYNAREPGLREYSNSLHSQWARGHHDRKEGQIVKVRVSAFYDPVHDYHASALTEKRVSLVEDAPKQPAAAAPVETKPPLPKTSRTLTIVSWINPDPLPGFSRAVLAAVPGDFMAREAACMAMGCTANTAPPALLPDTDFAAFVASKQYRAVQKYTIVDNPNPGAPSESYGRQYVGYTAPSKCGPIPPDHFVQGESSPLDYTSWDFAGKDPKGTALMKVRVATAEEDAAVDVATSGFNGLFISKKDIRHVPWVWTLTTLSLDVTTGHLKWFVRGSAFPTHTIYVDGVKVDEIKQDGCRVVLEPRFRTADVPRQSMAEEEKQANVPIYRQDETVSEGGRSYGER